MKQNFSQKQIQKQTLTLTQTMKKSLDVLKMNQEELVECMRELAFSNPFVELDESRDWNQIIEETFSKRPSLQDDLYMQLRTSGYAYDKNLCAYIIESLDSHGFFLEDQETATRVLDCSGEALKRALRCVQSLEPAGVAATSRNECVVLQLRKKNEDFAARIFQMYPEALAKKDLAGIAKAENVSTNRIHQALRAIQSCSLDPCQAYASEAPSYIRPDFEIKVAHEQIEIVPRTAGALRIDNQIGVLKEPSPEIKAYLEEARFFIDSVNKRNKTLLILMNELIRIQKNYFLFDDELNPCTLQQIAMRTGFHESTVSRTLSNKYYQYGDQIFAVKDLFISKTKGGTSKDSIVKALRQLVEQEDPDNPLSDQELSEALADMELYVSRRTVAKYRTSMKIPGSSQRKKKMKK
ncbi:RNA polymerase factor sigma-54 [uncultured Dubosiella sp.]|uniref:RNA polymerase factor sigma-54 n=1 Tax=uncultured Dubosiella sp. TaxID=1937011 RepID=UPI0025B01223|nr:RNA polymerase factor sigma-54 [uncultured Dubosiella sp.]